MITGLFRRIAVFFALAAASALVSGATLAQVGDYPKKQITIVVPFPPGSGTDTAARLLAQGMSNEYKVPVIVENKAGANGFMAASDVAHAAPDGYTLLLTGNTTHSSNQFLFKQLPYDPVKDFTPISLVFKGYLVLLVNASSSAKSVADLAAMAKQGKLNFASGSSTSLLSGEMFRQMAGLDLVNVPYKGNPQALIDLIGGRVDFMFADGSTAAPQIGGGKVRALAVTSSQRDALLPNIPAMNELGYQGYEVTLWTGIYAPAGTPPAVVERLNKTVRRLVNNPELQDWGKHSVFNVLASSPAELAQLQAAESERTSGVVRAAGIEPQ